MSKQTKTKSEVLSPIPTSATSDADSKSDNKSVLNRRNKPPSLTISTDAREGSLRETTIKCELYDPLSPTKTPDEFNLTLSEKISSFRAKSDEARKEQVRRYVNSSLDREEPRKEFRECERDVHRYDERYDDGKSAEYSRGKRIKTEIRQYNEYEKEYSEYRNTNRACASFKTYDPLADVSYLYEPKRLALKSNFASQLEQYFILDTPFTLTKSIEEDYPIPNNDFLVPPKWDLYAELFVEQAAEAHNWSFYEKKMIAITDQRLLKAQNAIIRVSGPLIGTLGTKVAVERNCSYQAIWISIGYAFWFLSRVRRQLLLEAVLGTRDRKKIDRYLGDANKMSMFWPDNSELLGKKFFDHIVVSERRQEEFRDVLMKDARRSSDQMRPRKHVLYRQPSESSLDLKEDCTYVSRHQNFRSSSFDCKGTFRYTEVRSTTEERSSKHSEASSIASRRSSRQTEVSSQSKRRHSKDDEDIDRREKRNSDTKHADDAPSNNDRISDRPKVRSGSGRDAVSKHTDNSSVSSRRNSRRTRSSSPPRSRRRRPSVDDRSSKNAPAPRKRRTSDEANGSYKKAKSSQKTSATISSETKKEAKVSCHTAKAKRSTEDLKDTRHNDITERYDVTTVETAKDTKLKASKVYPKTKESGCSANVNNVTSSEKPSENQSQVKDPISCTKPLAFQQNEVYSQVCISMKDGHVRCSEVSMGSTGASTSKEVEVTSHPEKRDVQTQAKERELNYAETDDSSKERGDGCCADLETSSLVHNAAKESKSICEPSRRVEPSNMSFGGIGRKPFTKVKGSLSELLARLNEQENEEEVKEEEEEEEEEVEEEVKEEEEVDEEEDLAEEGTDDQEEEEEGEIRDILTPFSVQLKRKKNSSMASFKKSTKENEPTAASKESNITCKTESNDPHLDDEINSVPINGQHKDCINSNYGIIYDHDPYFKTSPTRSEHEDSSVVTNRSATASQWDLSTSGNDHGLLEQKSKELAAQFDKNMKLEVEISFLKDTNKKLNDVNRELEDNLQSTQEQLEKKGSLLTDIQGKLDQLKSELDQVKEERSTFQTLACEKDTRISSLKSDNEAFKLKERGWSMEKKKLATQIEELQAQVAAQTKLLAEREDSLQKLQRDIDLLNSDQTINEQHRQQLTNLRLEIEQRKDKEKMFELEKLRLEKDKLVQDIETKAKLRHGEMEKTLDQVTDQNSKLSANIAALQNQLESQKKEVEEERETSAMFKAEAERDIKLQKQNAAMELEELKEQAAKRDAAYLEKIAALQTEIQNRPSGSGNTPNQDTPTVPTTSNPDTEQLTQQLRDQAREIDNLRAARARSLQIAVTQFQKGDTVFFYYDESKSNYLVANISPNDYQYFLHPDNLGALGLSLDPQSRKAWAIGVIKDKEFCQARKVNNRFKVPEGRKFYRVYAQPRANADPNNAPSNAPTNSSSSRNPD